jgi:voltage-gated potassium channel Kch
MRFFRVVRVLLYFWKGLDELAEIFDIKLMKKALIYISAIMVGGAAIIYYIEGNDVELSNFVQSVWWSFTTVVTGGFADIYNPTTTAGMVLTVILVLAGMVLVGVFTATLTSIMVGDESESTIDTLRVYLETRLEERDSKNNSNDSREKGES